MRRFVNTALYIVFFPTHTFTRLFYFYSLFSLGVSCIALACFAKGMRALETTLCVSMSSGLRTENGGGRHVNEYQIQSSSYLFDRG